MRTKFDSTPEKKSPSLKRTGYSKFFNTTGLLLLLLAVFTWQCKKDKFIPSKGLCPAVVSTDPSNGDTGVVINKKITASFNQVMDPATINGATFLLNQGANAISGTVTYSGSTATFSPSAPLLSHTVYTGTITTGAKNPTADALPANYVWSFTTGSLKDTIRPLVVSTDPLNLATNVVLNKVVTATFSKTMDGTTITATSFMLKQGTNSVTGVLSTAGSTVSFVPSSMLLPSTLYTGIITTAAKDNSGNALAANYTWTFTTGTALDTTRPTVILTDPLNLATNVITSKTITVTFSENVQLIGSSTFTLTQGVNTIGGAIVSLGGTSSFTFKPTNPLAPGTTYTGTIKGAPSASAVMDMSNNKLLTDYVWTFTTAAVVGDTIRPTVILVDPLNLATNVPINKVITATFSELMNSNSITAILPSTFVVKLGTIAIGGNVTYSGVMASFTPSMPLIPGTVYNATITTVAMDLATNHMLVDYNWSFTTAPVGDTTRPTVISTDPVNLATLVPLNKVVKATFSELMDNTSVLATAPATFTLKHGTVIDTGVVTMLGMTASYTPAHNLLANTTYTATITNAAKDVAQNTMLNNYVWTFTTVNATFTPWVNLNSAGNFGILAGVGISNAAGFSVINDMNVGIYPGARSSVTGFPPGIVVNGAIICSDDGAAQAALLLQAKTDLTNAYLQAEGATAPAPATVSGDQGGKTLAPGIYKSTSTLLISAGNLTLDGGGDPNAQWIFQIASAFTTVGGAGGSVILSGSAQAKNIYWQVGSSATLGSYTDFKGNILALTSITMGAYGTATGRMLARNGAVTLTSTNIINKP
jgi:hypothetical protein